MTSANRTILLATSVALLLASAAHAEMIPLLDLRQLHTKAVYEGLPDEITSVPFANFGAWNWYDVAQVYGDEAGEASATAFQNSQMSSDTVGSANGFLFSGGTSGQFQVGVGSYEALSL